MNDHASERVAELLERWAAYQRSRRELLTEIGIPASNRDPLSEFSEVLVAAITGAERAPNRVQKGYDLVASDGHTIEVKYLSNPSASWVNWHVIENRGDWDEYALVYFEELQPKSVLVFTRTCFEPLYDRLKKRHKGRGSALEITSSVYAALMQPSSDLSDLGVRVYRLAN